MSKLEALFPGIAIRGILPDSVVTVVTAQFGSNAPVLTYKTASGSVENELIIRYNDSQLEVSETGKTWSFDGDCALFSRVSEAHRIRLAHP
ncbi:MAG: hypothetical protein MK210_17630 [Dehalococcoidia bacterium]|nr:hypothetical protein [Dehalococcoidia bacterium]